MKLCFSSKMIFVQDLKFENANKPMMSKLDASLKSFLDENAHCFFETIDLAPPR